MKQFNPPDFIPTPESPLLFGAPDWHYFYNYKDGHWWFWFDGQDKWGVYHDGQYLFPDTGQPLTHKCQRSKVGDVFASLIKSISRIPTEGCGSCEYMINNMNRWGKEGCNNNRHMILGIMKDREKEYRAYKNELVDKKWVKVAKTKAEKRADVKAVLKGLKKEGLLSKVILSRGNLWSVLLDEAIKRAEVCDDNTRCQK